MRPTLALFALVALACTGASSEDSAPDLEDTAVDEGPEPTGCDVLEVGFDGEDPPTVGDTWTVWPICDGSFVMGAMVVRVDPSEAATIADGEVTWVSAGTHELMVQSGSQKAYLDVTVESE